MAGIGEIIALAKGLGGSGGGGSSGGLLVTLTYDGDLGLYVCDKTAKEMWEGAQNGAFMFKLTLGSDTQLYAIKDATKDSSGGYVFTMSTGEYFEADSDSGYPSGSIS